MPGTERHVQHVRERSKRTCTPALMLAAVAAALVVRDSEILSLGALLISAMIGAAMLLCEYAEREEQKEGGTAMDEYKIDMTERLIQATAELTPYSAERLWDNWSLLSEANNYDYTATLRDFLASSFLRP